MEINVREKVNITETLEALIDKSSLLDVLVGLELVCIEKAEHIRHNWQDSATARVWDHGSKAVLAAARKVEHFNI